MYRDTITLFNFYKSNLGDMWYPTVISGVNLMIDKSAIVAKYGAESKDNAILNIRFTAEPGEETLNGGPVAKRIMVDGKEYLPPKEWERQTNDRLAESITFASGTEFDFFMLGEYPEAGPIQDDDFRNGLFEAVKKEYDYVFAITSVAKYNTIPHFEITGK